MHLIKLAISNCLCTPQELLQKHENKSVKVFGVRKFYILLFANENKDFISSLFR